MTTPSLLTTHQVAALLGITRQRVNKLAATRNLGTVNPWGFRLFSEADIAAMRVPGKPGRPRKDAE